MSQIIEHDSGIIQKAERKVDSWSEKENELEKQGEDDKDMEEEVA